MIKDIGLDEVMTRGVITIERDVSVVDAMKKMIDRRVTSLVVEKGENNEYGMITRRDIITRIIAKGKNPAEVKVGEIMSEPLMTVPLNHSILEVARLMVKHGTRRFPVAEDGRLIGMISNADIMKSETIELLPENRRHAITNLRKRFSSISAKTQSNGAA